MSLEDRVATLESLVRTVQCRGITADDVAVDAVRRDLVAHEACGAALVRVPDDYYAQPLHNRAYLLRTRVESLCKTLVFEALSAAGEHVEHVAVVVQYVARLDLDRLVRYLHGKLGRAISLRAAEDIVEICGQPTGGVSPFGWPRCRRLLVTKGVATLPASGIPFVWLGGGHPSVKLRVTVRDLVSGAEVVDCAEAREDEDE